MENGPNALSLISDFYESDDSESVDEAISNSSRPTMCDNLSKLPVPESLKNLYCEPVHENVSDLPELHGGRIRSFSHERGNWATSVFIRFKRSSYLMQISSLFVEQCANISKFSPCDDFHLSLSRTVVIRHHWIEPLVQEIELKTKTLESFPLEFDEIGVYVNDEKTRTFVALKVGIGFHQLVNCVTAVDHCLSEFRLPKYYENPSFHLSLIWCVGDKKEELNNLLPTLRKMFHKIRDADFHFQSELVTCICCKTGNRTFSFQLKS